MSKLFLKLGKVIGSSTDPEHVQWIELLSCRFPPQTRNGNRDPAPPREGPYLKPQIELWCSKMFDASSGPLFKMMNDGSAVDSGALEFVDGDGVAQTRMSLRDVTLTSFSTRAGPPTSENSVMETLGLMCVLDFSVPDRKFIQPMSVSYPYNLALDTPI
jgi:type VI protein secretion system component Hcp